MAVTLRQAKAVRRARVFLTNHLLRILILGISRDPVWPNQRCQRLSSDLVWASSNTWEGEQGFANAPSPSCDCYGDALGGNRLFPIPRERRAVLPRKPERPQKSKIPNLVCVCGA